MELLTVCVSLIIGTGAIATIFVSGWVKSSQLSDIRASTKEQINSLRDDINQLWEKISKVEVLSSKLDTMEKGIDEIKELIRNKKEI